MLHGPRPTLRPRDLAIASTAIAVLAVAAMGAAATSSPDGTTAAIAPTDQAAPATEPSTPTAPITDVPLRPAPQATGTVGLAALYAELGLAVPTDVIPRDQRPGCAPRRSAGGDSVAVEGGGGAPVEVPIVPDDELPAPMPLVEFTPDASIVDGHGMWLWQYTKTEGGDYDRMIARAVKAGLDHVWVRVGDSRDGFYAKEYLDEFVPRAHAAGLDVIGWGFPFLHDPLADTAWVNEALAWVGPHGRGIDAYSPDIERETEGVILSPERVVIHLASLRASNPELPIIATVYPATDWIMETDYPFEQMAPYVDGFATMDYWACGDSGLRAAHSIRRLEALRPVHVIGQAFTGGRSQPPSPAETLRFLDTAVREEANGASWWVWQLIGDEQWDTISRYPWDRAVESNGLDPQPAVIPES